jgi:hypothetical protein
LGGRGGDGGGSGESDFVFESAALCGSTNVVAIAVSDVFLFFLCFGSVGRFFRGRPGFRFLGAVVAVVAGRGSEASGVSSSSVFPFFFFTLMVNVDGLSSV